MKAFDKMVKTYGKEPELVVDGEKVKAGRITTEFGTEVGFVATTFPLKVVDVDFYDAKVEFGDCCGEEKDSLAIRKSRVVWADIIEYNYGICIILETEDGHNFWLSSEDDGSYILSWIRS